MDKYELNGIIFQAALAVFRKNNNWIRYGDLCVFTLARVKTTEPEIDMDAVEKWIKECIEIGYISVERSRQDEITADDYCRGEWLGLDKE